MSKLHELLAVETDVHGQADSCRTELTGTFEHKKQHFSKRLVVVRSRTEGIPEKIESQLTIQTTVRNELKWIGEKIAKALDLGYQIDVANTTAVADLVLEDGATLVKNVPTTALLRMSHRLSEIKALVYAIPTLDPAKNFVPDPSQGDGIYRGRDEESVRGAKKFDYIVMVPPTPQHPAMVKELMLDIPDADIIKQEWSSLITVSEKATMLDRIEEVMRAVKKARAVANGLEVDVRSHVIGGKVLDYVFNGKVPA